MRFIFTTISILVFSALTAQITTTKPTKLQEKVIPTIYDSTENYLLTDIQRYVGQQFYGRGMGLYSNYKDFFIDYKKDTWTDNKNRYKSDGLYTKSEAIAGKYFDVLEMVEFQGSKFLKIREKESGDVIYYKHSIGKYGFPFIVVGYFEKTKKQYVGKQYISRSSEVTLKRRPIVDIQTGQSVKVEPCQNWKVVDLTVDETFYELSFVMENEAGNLITVEIEEANDAFFFFPILKSNILLEQFGEDNWRRIVSFNLVPGMTEEMCEASYGKPESINTTRTTEGIDSQWVYPFRYLYFENGILTAIQNN